MPNIQKTSRSILHHGSFQLCDNIIQSITEKLEQFLFVQKQSYNILKEKILSNELMEISAANKKEKESLLYTIF